MSLLAAAVLLAFAARPPDGTYDYRWTTADQTLIGSSSVTISGSAHAVSVRTQTTLQTVTAGNALVANGSLGRSTSIYDPGTLQLRSFSSVVATGNSQTSTELHAAHNALGGTITVTGQVSQAVSVPLVSGRVVTIDDGSLGTALLLPAAIAASGTTLFTVLQVPANTTLASTFSTSSVGPFPFGVPATNVLATGSGGSVQLWYDPTTYVVTRLQAGPYTATLLLGG